MSYIIKAFLLLPDNSMDCRFEFICPDVDTAIEVVSRVSFEAYDVVKVLPFN